MGIMEDTVSCATQVVAGILSKFKQLSTLSISEIASCVYLSKDAKYGDLVCSYLLKILVPSDVISQLATTQIDLNSGFFSSCHVMDNGFVNFRFSSQWYKKALDSLFKQEFEQSVGIKRNFLLLVVPPDKFDQKYVHRQYLYAQTMARLLEFVGCHAEMLNFDSHHYEKFLYALKPDKIIVVATFPQADLAKNITCKINHLLGERKAEFVAIQAILLPKDTHLYRYISADFVKFFINSKEPCKTITIDPQVALCENRKNPFYRAVYMYKRINKILQRENSCTQSNFTNSEIELIKFSLCFYPTLQIVCDKFDTSCLVDYLSQLSQLFFAFYFENNLQHNQSPRNFDLCCILKRITENIFSILNVLLPSDSSQT